MCQCSSSTSRVKDVEVETMPDCTRTVTLTVSDVVTKPFLTFVKDSLMRVSNQCKKGCSPCHLTAV